MMQRLSKSFVRGLLILLPMIVTIFLLWKILGMLDSFVPVEIPGLGLVLAVTATTGVGIFSSQPGGRQIMMRLARLFERMPVVKVVYTPIRDLLNALVGDRKSFDKPIIVDIVPDGSVRAFGFVTCEYFDDPQLAGYVAVYLPQSYNIAGNMLIVRRDRVRPLDAEPGAFMAFIVSGGVADMPASGTVVMDRDSLIGSRLR